jgi:large subunit ribosomal protein L4e
MYLTAELLKKTGGSEAPVIGLDGEVVERVRLPYFFNISRRADLVRRAYIHLATHTLQPKGSSKGSGHKHSVESWGPGYGMARISRVRGRGTPKYMAGGMVPSAVGGRPTHPPVPEKKIHKRLNWRESRLALLTALSFTASKSDVAGRGHRLPESLETPLVVADELEKVAKTKELESFLKRLGLGEELNRCGERKIRAGKGKMRGRRYKERVGPLIVVREDNGVRKAAGNIPGVSVVEARNLSILHLAPGGHPGRLTIYTKSAIEALGERLS